MLLTNYQKRVASWLLIAALIMLIIWLLAPVLTPFVVAAVLAYALSPIVDKLQIACRGKVSRWLAAIIVEGIFIVIIISIFMLVLPLFVKQVPQLLRQLPNLIEQAQVWLQQQLQQQGIEIELNAQSYKIWLESHFNGGKEAATSTAGSLLSSLKVGGNVLLSILGNLILIPMALYYLLVDWKRFVSSLLELIPRPMRDSTISLANDIDSILGQYLRGQLLVMLIMALFYSIGLMLFGLDLAWSIGIFTGLAMFIPYVGVTFGAIMAILAGTVQLGFFDALIMTAVVFTIGQIAESFVLTPRLVGERIGLHPLVVIFALLAFGQLFGFIGVLIALPASAALLVAVRRVRSLYFSSTLYKN